MLCERCGKNEATVHYSEIINGKKRSAALCADCAEKLGIGGAPSPLDIFGTGSLFSGFFGDIFDHPKAVTSSNVVRCPVCGATLSDIAAEGKVGCSECYRTFRAELSPTIRRIHGGVTYKGSQPAKDAPDEGGTSDKPVSELDALRAELYEAIKKEDFERAAELRDRIKALEA